MEIFNCKILDEKYALRKTIGEGATSKVMLSIDVITGKKYAVKILKSGSKINPSEKVFKKEIKMLKRINHPNVIKILEGSVGLIKKLNESQKRVHYIVLEMAENGDLFDYMSFTKKGFGEEYGRYLFKELIEGLEACHMAGVAHRDLKLDNIMLGDDWDLKIADFGYATLISGKDKSGKLCTPVGTLSYAAPEILSKKTYYGLFADIFSCGVILFILVTGKLPFELAVMHDPFYKYFIVNDYEGFWTTIESVNGSYSSDFKSLVTLLLSFNPAQRPTINEVKNHHWYLSECITKDKMRKEFEMRKIIINRMRKIKATNNKNHVQANTNRVTKVGSYKASNKNYLFTELDIDDELGLSLNRYIGYYVENQNPYIILTDISDPNDLLVLIYKYLMENNERKKTVKVSQITFSLDVSYELDLETSKNLDGIEIETLKLKINIKKTEDENLIIEFRKIQGEKQDFYELYDKFITPKEFI